MAQGATLDAPPPLPANLAAPQASLQGLSGQQQAPGGANVPDKPIIEALAMIDQRMADVGRMKPALGPIMQTLRDTMRQQVAPVLMSQQGAEQQGQPGQPGVGGMVTTPTSPGMMS